MKRKITIYLGLILSIVFVIYIAKTVDFSGVLVAFKTFNPKFIVILLGLYLYGMLIRTIRWRMLIAQQKKMSLITVFSALVTGFMVNNVLPAKIGELVRAEYVAREGRLSRGFSLGTVFAERMLDTILVLIFLFGSVIFSKPLINLIRLNVWFLAILVGAFVIILLILLVKPIQNHLIGFLPRKYQKFTHTVMEKTSQSVSFLKQKNLFLKVGALTILIWLGVVLGFFLIFLSMGIRLPLYGYFAVVSVGTIGMVIPSTSANIGVYDAVVMSVITLFAVNRDTAFAVAAIAHALDIVPSIVLGLSVLLVKNFSTYVLRFGGRMFSKVFSWQEKLIAKIIPRLISNFILISLKKVAFKGYGGNKCFKKGFLPLPVHFYSPVPDISDLKKRKVWDKRSDLTGIDFNEKKQLDLLEKLGNQYANECDWPLQPTRSASEYFVNNQGFSYGCAASTHSIIRNYKPGRVIEIGSGSSSQVIYSALNLNKIKDKNNSEYTIVDPYPAYFISRGPKPTPYCDKIIEEKVELLPLSFFNQLKKNDILFIDSGHTVRTGSDVNFLYLDVLPRLAPGVIVHIHDISLPYEYPKEYATREQHRYFWTEQYLLQSFLTHNHEFEVLLAMSYLMADHKNEFEKAFPLYNPNIHLLNSGSFWIRRKI